MADYIYLMETRLTRAQQDTLHKVVSAARLRSMTVFLVGGAVRDLTTGSPVRDLDIAVQGNAVKLKKDLISAGGVLTGESEPLQALYFSFPGGVRLEVSSTLELSYPKPGKPVAKPANILDDLRRRDFTANAMAVSLNEGSYGLLMDPLNGIADIDNRELRLVSNYGFVDDPARMIRAVRLSARLGWHMEEKTQKRYEAGKSEGYISALSAWQKGYETEEIFHEEDPLRAFRRIESEGWGKFLFPAWTSAKANESELNRLRDILGQLESMGIHPDPSAAFFPVLTAKLAPKDVAALKKSFVRPGFVSQIAALDAETKAFATQFTSKAAAAPSDAWKMLMSAVPEQVLWLAWTAKGSAVQAKFKAFFTEWPAARQKIPYQIMQEMRITSDLPVYAELLEKLFFAIMDKKLESPEAVKAFLDPFSPPAPPPPVNMRRRPLKRDVKPVKSRAKKTAVEPTASVVADDTVATPKPVAKVPSVKVTPSKVERLKTVVPKSSPKPVDKGTKAGAKTEKKVIPSKSSIAKAVPATKATAAKKVTKSLPKAQKKTATVTKPKPSGKAKTSGKSVPKPAGKQSNIKKASLKKPVRPVSKTAKKKKGSAVPKQKTVPSKKPVATTKKPVVKKVAKKSTVAKSKRSR